MKVLSLNFCSLRSLEKRARLQTLVNEHKPDIIIECETHLDESYLTTEVFPLGYTIIQKDHCSGGGGVFLAISSGIPFLDVSIDANVEMIWAKILPIQGKTLLLGSFYRPPDSNPTPMEEFKVFLLSFSQAKNFKNIIIAGDFNFPTVADPGFQKGRFQQIYSQALPDSCPAFFCNTRYN